MIAALLLPAAAAAAPCCDPASPYREGEGMAGAPATCANLGHWLDRMPDLGSRVSLTLTGPLAAVDRDEALAYLVLCPGTGAQALCLTYDTLGMQPGQTVTVAGGVVPAGAGRGMLDPCLAYPQLAAPEADG